MTTLNIPLFEQIKKHITEEPNRLRMDRWIINGFPSEKIYTSLPGYGEPNDYQIPACGTVACIAGWAVKLTHPEIITANAEDPSISIIRKAQDILGINPYEEPFSLFYVDGWPNELEDNYREAKSQKERAEIVCRVIDLYITRYQQGEY